MQTSTLNRSRSAGSARQAFSLVELLTAVSIMVVIIFALYAMFSQTQKALRANVTQVDVLESGRATAEMLGRDLEQVTACNLSQAVNFYVRMSTNLPVLQLDFAQNASQAPLRTNVLQDFFFLSRQTNSWVGTGYRVLGATNGVGTLYRYTITTNYQYLNFTNLISGFFSATPVYNASGQVLTTNFNRVGDGVIHLRLIAYDPQGRRMGWETTNTSSSYKILRSTGSGVKLGLLSSATNALDATVQLQQDPRDIFGVQTKMYFVSNAIPGSIEIELGVLESFAAKQLDALRDSPPKVAQSFLAKQGAKVHLFRQRIPLRTVQQ